MNFDHLVHQAAIANNPQCLKEIQQCKTKVTALLQSADNENKQHSKWPTFAGETYPTVLQQIVVNSAGKTPSDTLKCVRIVVNSGWECQLNDKSANRFTDSLLHLLSGYYDLKRENKPYIPYNHELLMLVLNADGIDISSLDISYNTIVHSLFLNRAVRTSEQRGEIIRKCHEIEMDFNLSAQNYCKQTALHLACKNNYELSTIRLLIKKGTNCSLIDDDGNTPLILLLSKKSFELSEFAKVIDLFVVEGKTDVNIVNKQQESAITLTIAQMDIELLGHLLFSVPSVRITRAVFDSSALEQVNEDDSELGEKMIRLLQLVKQDSHKQLMRVAESVSKAIEQALSRLSEPSTSMSTSAAKQLAAKL